MNESSEKKCKYGSLIDLREIEESTLLEAQEWARRRIEDKLRAKAAAFSPRREKMPAEPPVPGVDH